jgi:hypothetical protein
MKLCSLVLNVFMEGPTLHLTFVTTGKLSDDMKCTITVIRLCVCVCVCVVCVRVVCVRVRGGEGAR